MDRIIDKQEISNARRKKWLRTAAWLVPAAAILIWGITFIGAKTVKASDLTMGKAEKGPLRTTVAASGRMVPAFEEIVNSPVSSRIIAVYAQPGDSVSAGTPLLQLDLHESETQFRNLHDSHIVKKNQLDQLRLSNRSALDELDTRIDIKEMEVNRLAITVDNERRLDSLGSGTGDRVRQAETAYSTGLLELKGLRRKLDNERARLASLEEAAILELGNSARDLEMMDRTLSQGRIPAPHDGILTYLSNSIGSAVAAGEKVAVVGDLSCFKVEADVPEGRSDFRRRAILRHPRRQRQPAPAPRRARPGLCVVRLQGRGHSHPVWQLLFGARHISTLRSRWHIEVETPHRTPRRQQPRVGGSHRRHRSGRERSRERHQAIREL